MSVNTLIPLLAEQIRILTVSEKVTEYAESVEKKLLSAGIRAKTDLRNEKIGAKIREGRLDLVSYLAVVGEKESSTGTCAVRSRKERELGEIAVEALIEKLTEIAAGKQRLLQSGF